MIFRALLTALKSVPVTSMNMFSVSGVKAVTTPLMIGGKESTCSFSSRIRGSKFLPSRIQPYSRPFSCSFRIRPRDISLDPPRGTKANSSGPKAL